MFGFPKGEMEYSVVSEQVKDQSITSYVLIMNFTKILIKYFQRSTIRNFAVQLLNNGTSISFHTIVPSINFSHIV